MQVVLHDKVVSDEIANLANPEIGADHFPALRYLHIRPGNYF